MNKDELIANLGTIARSGSKVTVVVDLPLVLFVLFLHFSFPLCVIYFMSVLHEGLVFRVRGGASCLFNE